MPSPDESRPGAGEGREAGGLDPGQLDAGQRDAGQRDAGHHDAGQLRVSVVYALPEEQHIVALTLPGGVSVEQAVQRSGLLQRFPSIFERPLRCAVFNRVVEGAEPVRAGDRIEILRPLQIDPKEARRREAARSRRKQR